MSESLPCFYQAALRAPLFADAWKGLARCYALEGHARNSERCLVVSGFLQKNLALRFQLTSLRQLACWILFFFGIVMHSRISAAFALGAVSLCIAGAHFAPSWAAVFGDIHFVYNLTGIFLVCGGLYLRLNILTVPWLAAVTLALAGFWNANADRMSAAGLPLLCLPFNVALVLTIAVFLLLRRCGLGDHVVPLDWAATSSPGKIGLGMMKRDIANACWKKLHEREAGNAVG